MIGTKVKNTWADEPKRLERQLQTNPLNSLRPQEVSGPLEQEFYNMERHFFHLFPFFLRLVFAPSCSNIKKYEEKQLPSPEQT
jgi:hypothetical protein